MTPPILRIAGCALGLFATGWTAITLSAEPSPHAAVTETAELLRSSEAKSLAVAQMEKEQARVIGRLGVAAPMELELENGIDPIQEAVDNGFIIEATLEEVEAALAAAAASKDPDDISRANELAHRGSYRFFMPNKAILEK